MNIDGLTADDIEEPVLTGGYLLEFDSNEDEKIYLTDIFSYPLKIKEPDDVTDVQAKYTLDYLNSLEAVLSDEKKVVQRIYVQRKVRKTLLRSHLGFGPFHFFLLNESVYHSALLKDAKFRVAVKQEWQKLKSNLENGFSIYDYIDTRSTLIKDEIAKDDILFSLTCYTLRALRRMF